MSRTDPIADMLTCMRNAGFARKVNVDIPASKLSQEILRVLKREGFIKNYKFIEDNKQGLLRVYLKFNKNKQVAFTALRRISKPSLRLYVKGDNIPEVLGGLGIAILSTSKGVMTNKAAKKLNVGGEILCNIS